MKKLIILSAIVLSSVMVSNKANAQLRVNLNLNLGPVTAWISNDNINDYSYLPDIDCYYSPSQQVYVYRDGNNWQRNRVLPERYRNFDFAHVRMVSMQGQQRPYMNHEVNRNNWAGNDNRRGQQPVQQRQQPQQSGRDFRNDNRWDGRRS